MNFKIGPGSTSGGEEIATSEQGGHQITLKRSSYEQGGRTFHMLHVSGFGKPRILNPFQVAAILDAKEEIESYFQDVGLM